MQPYIPYNVMEAIHRANLPDPRIQVMIADSPLRIRRRPRYRIGAVLVRLGSWLKGEPTPVASTATSQAAA